MTGGGAFAYIHGAGPQAQIDPSGNHTYLLGDVLSSIRGLTDSSGTLAAPSTMLLAVSVRKVAWRAFLDTPATGLLHLRARDLNPALGRFLRVDTVQPNAPGSQGFNVYSYVAGNPTTWVDPSGHFGGLSGYWGTEAFAPNVAVLGAVTAMSIAAVLAMGRNPESWRFSKNFLTSAIVYATYAALLVCAAIRGCITGAMANGSLAASNGSASPYGARPWTPDALPDAPDTHPESPLVIPPWIVRPWEVPFVVAPGDGGDNNPGGPNWPGIGILIGIGTIIGTIVGSGPARPPAPGQPGPQPQPVPTPQPIPTPVGTPLPTPDRDPQHRGRLQIQGKDLRQEVSWPWAQSTPPKKTTALAELALLWNQLSRREQQLRTQAYKQVQGVIQKGPLYAEFIKTYQNNNLPPKNQDARIDIEVRKGIAFVD